MDGLKIDSERLPIFAPSDLFLGKQRLKMVEMVDSAAYRELYSSAEALLQTPVPNIVNKKQAPPSGDKHDFLSYSRYHWPNPNTLDGLPYIYRDGLPNPHLEEVPDEKNLNHMISTVYRLSLVGSLADEKKFNDRAVEIIKSWFIDANTKMNPHLRYAEAVMGENEGSYYGIIAFHQMPWLLDSIALLEASGAFSEDETKVLNKWFSDYLTWLQTSDMGKLESKSKNNHGTWYDVQVASIAQFLGRNNLVKEIITQVPQKRMDGKILATGEQPEETIRTRSWEYSIFNALGLAVLAKIGERQGVDLWHYRNPEGGGIRQAVEYLALFQDDLGAWPHKQIVKDPSKEYCMWLYALAQNKYPESKYSAVLRKTPREAHHLTTLLFQDNISSN